MNRRWRWVGVVALVGSLLLVAGARRGADAHAQAEPHGGEFVHAGRFIINKSRIDYVERGERGQVYVCFTSKNSIVVTGDATKALLQALGADEASRAQ